MLVKNHMTPHPITVHPEEPINDAQQLMRENGIKHLPVVDSGKCLIGILTPSRFSITAEKTTSLDVWEITNRLSQIIVGDVMVTGNNVISTHPQATLEEATRIIIENNITGLPVVSDRIVVGIITQTDLLAQLYYLLGGDESGWRVVLRMPDRKGDHQLGKTYNVITNQGWSIRALGGAKAKDAPGKWDAIVKIRYCDSKEDLLAVLSSLKDQEILDIRPYGIKTSTGEL